MKKVTLFIFFSFITAFLFAQSFSNRNSSKPDSFAIHKVVFDSQSELISRIPPQSKAYDQFLHQCWNFIKTMVPDSPGPASRSPNPIYYFYCDYRNTNNTIVPCAWMNDAGEKIPDLFESARLYYACTGDTTGIFPLK